MPTGGNEVDYFLKVDGIQGESVDPKHKDEIELVSYSWGLAHASSPGGAGAGGATTGRAHFHDFSFTMPVNEASPKLFLAAASGRHLKDATLTVRKAGKDQLEYLRITFSDVVVTSFEQAGDQEPPREAVSLAFDRIEIEYSQPTPTGAPSSSFTAGWDLSQNKEL
jgi:type VI secretion system secreted protein Hcp